MGDQGPVRGETEHGNSIRNGKEETLRQAHSPIGMGSEVHGGITRDNEVKVLGRRPVPASEGTLRSISVSLSSSLACRFPSHPWGSPGLVPFLASTPAVQRMHVSGETTSACQVYLRKRRSYLALEEALCNGLTTPSAAGLAAWPGAKNAQAHPKADVISPGCRRAAGIGCIRADKRQSGVD